MASLRPYHATLVGESYLGMRRPVYECTEVQVRISYLTLPPYVLRSLMFSVPFSCFFFFFQVFNTHFNKLVIHLPNNSILSIFFKNTSSL